jgi:multicomponent Na+:H+ antiporter subunit B
LDAIVYLGLFTGLAVVTLAIVRQHNLLGVVILASVYSFLIASVMIVLDAVDVAMTEASVGAGLSTVLLLAALHLTRTREYPRKRPNLLAGALSAVVGVGLVWGSLVLPPFGVADAPIHQHVAPRYLQEGAHEVGVPNIVTAVLADYRAFDTLGETTVVFVAALAVMLLLGGPKSRQPEPEEQSPAMSSDVVLRVGAKLVLPFILMFALYVHFHGDYGPGGGFQAGVIAAAAIILVGLTFGLRRARRLAPLRLVHVLIPLGMLIFAGTGLVSLAFGANYLDYAVLAADPHNARHLGILLVETGVLVTVSSAMVGLYYAFVMRGR